VSTDPVHTPTPIAAEATSQPPLVEIASTLAVPPADLARRREARQLLDVVLAGVALAVLSLPMAVIGVLVRRSLRGPALFRQERLGLHGRPFVMLKFRTMYIDSDDRMHRDYVQALLNDAASAARGSDGLYKLVDDPRITPLGRWLRKTSVDELPQLINVLRGEMSLVGPRPVLPWEAMLFDPRYYERFRVRPGITGLWQTNGRNRLTMTQALDFDVEYVRNQSLRLDLAILLRTIPVVLGRQGVS
jgi:lipopolysaccharide/colanic/teichoic acid biosynthesis glycosyltransferase